MSALTTAPQMHITFMQEQLSKAYVRAVCAACGYRVSEPEVDDDSVDMTIGARGGEGTIRSPKLDVQLKCTHEIDLRRSSDFSFTLKKKNYDELRPTDYHVARILVVVRVPESPTEWLRHSEEDLLVRHCGYWASLYGMPELASMQQFATVRMDRANLFDVQSLTGIMNRLSSGGRP